MRESDDEDLHTVRYLFRGLFLIVLVIIAAALFDSCNERIAIYECVRGGGKPLECRESMK